MLPQVASGTIETRHIVTPIRISKTKFYEAKIKNIDPHGKSVTLHQMMILHYDFLIVALEVKLISLE